MDSTNPDYKYKKELSSYCSSCVYCAHCAHLNRTASYRNLDGDEQLVSGSVGGATGNHSVGVENDSDVSMTRGRAGELSYFEVVDFAHQIARGMEHLEKMKVSQPSVSTFFMR